MRKIEEKLKEFAKKFGLADVEYLGKRGIFGVYLCVSDEEDVSSIGLPIFLLENGGEVRVASNMETLSLMDFLED